MNYLMFTLALLMLVGAVIFAKFAWREYARFRRLRCDGVRTKGIIFSEAPGRIGQNPMPIVRFEDEGVVREFRSHFPRRTKGFIHPEEAEVLYCSDTAELSAAAPAIRHVGRGFAFSVLFLVTSMFFFLQVLK